jgi:hypothetical protein
MGRKHTVMEVIMSLKKTGIIISLVGFILSSVYAQNETSKDFVQGTVLAHQAGSSFDKFPKMEIGFVGRYNNANDPLAYLFIRFQSTLETGGGVFHSYLALNRNTNQLEQIEGDSLRQFISLLYQAVIVGEVAKYREAVSIDMELGEIELMDFQWYMTQNQWKYARNKTCRIKVKVQTVNNENRLYFYRTSNLRDSRNEFDTFTMPDDTYLTESQCQRIIDAYETKDSFVWRAVDIAIDSIKRTLR